MPYNGIGVGISSSSLDGEQNSLQKKLQMGGPNDMTQTFEQICMDNGYSVKEYVVKTPDGYHLKLFRIQSKLNLNLKRASQEGFSWSSELEFGD